MKKRVIIPGVILGLIFGASTYLYTHGAGTPLISRSPDPMRVPKIEPSTKPSNTRTSRTEEIRPREQTTPPGPTLTRPEAVDSAGRRSGEPALPALEPRKTGILNLNAQPWAEIWVDGKSKGQTPLELKLSAGRHRVVFVYENQRFSRSVTVHVGGEEALTHDWQEINK